MEGHEADHSPSNAKVKIAWVYMFILLYVFFAWGLIKEKKILKNCIERLIGRE